MCIMPFKKKWENKGLELHIKLKVVNLSAPTGLWLFNGGFTIQPSALQIAEHLQIGSEVLSEKQANLSFFGAYSIKAVN